MNRTIAAGLIEELSKISLLEKYEQIVWPILHVSTVTASCWPEWKARDSFYAENAMRLNRAQGSTDDDFYENLKGQYEELSIFLNNKKA